MSKPHPFTTTDPHDPAAISELLAFHRATFGDARMDAEGEQGSQEQPVEGEQKRPAPWEKSGEEFDAEKAKALIINLQRERDQEREQRRAADAKIKEHDDAQMSETDRLQRERDEAVQRAQLVDRYEIAAEVDLPLSWARRLVGGDRDALLSDAKSIKAELDEKSRPGIPQPDPSQGGGSSTGRATSLSDAVAEYRNRKSKTNT